MMHPLEELIIGSNEIPVQIFEGPGKRRRQINYEPHRLVVFIPQGDGVDGAFEFLAARESRVLEGWREVRERHGRIAEPGDGGNFLPWKVLYRGKKRPIDARGDGPRSPRWYRNAIEVHRGDEATDDDVRTSIKQFFWNQLQDEVSALAERHAKRLGIRAVEAGVGDIGSLWGAVCTDGSLAFHWRLAHAPKGSIEYAVLHLLTHLRHRFHNDLFDVDFHKASEGIKIDAWWLERYAWILDLSDGDRL